MLIFRGVSNVCVLFPVFFQSFPIFPVFRSESQAMSALHLEIPLVSLCLGYDPVGFIQKLGGDCLFLPLLGEMIQFEEHIFEMGWSSPTRKNPTTFTQILLLMLSEIRSYYIVGMNKMKAIFFRKWEFLKLSKLVIFLTPVWTHPSVIYRSLLSIPKVGATYCHLTRPCDVGPLCYEFQSGHSKRFIGGSEDSSVDLTIPSSLGDGVVFECWDWYVLEEFSEDRMTSEGWSLYFTI